MNIGQFDSFDEMWMYTIAAIRDHGADVPSRFAPCRELCGFTARLLDTTANWLFNPGRRMAPHYAGGEFLWYLAGSDSIDFISYYTKNYGNFSDDGKIARGAYGPRIMEVLGKIIDELRRDPGTRQAVVPIYRPHDIEFFGKTKDMPCSLSLQFIRREAKLNMIVTMRSNDAWLGMPYDLWCFTCIQHLVANSLKLPSGWCQWNVGSMHVYDRNQTAAYEAITESVPSYSLDLCNPFGVGFPGNVQHAIELEEFARVKQNFCARSLGSVGEYSYLAANLAMAACKVKHSHAEFVTDKNLRKYVEGFYDVNN